MEKVRKEVQKLRGDDVSSENVNGVYMRKAASEYTLLLIYYRFPRECYAVKSLIVHFRFVHFRIDRFFFF